MGISFNLNSQVKPQDYSELSYKDLDSLATLTEEAQDFERYLLCVQTARQKAQEEFGQEDSVYAHYTTQLGIYYYEAREYTKALALYEEALAIQEKVLDSKINPSLAITYNELGILKTDMGAFEEALQLILKSKDIREQFYGKKHKAYARSLNDLAYIYSETGDIKMAIKQYEEVIGIEKELYEENDEASALRTFHLYLKRSKIEGVFKFLKNQLGWEEFQVRDLLAIKHLIVLSYFIGAYFYELEPELTKNEYMQELCKLGGGKGKVTRHFFLKGLERIYHFEQVARFFKEQNMSPEEIKRFMDEFT